MYIVIMSSQFVRLTLKSRKALEELAKASGCSMTRVVEALLLNEHKRWGLNPEAPVSFPRD